MSEQGALPRTSEQTATLSGAVEQALQRSLEVLSRRPSALITDIDGTISRIVAHPADATVEPGIGAALATLAGALDLVAVVTGRDEAVARAMVGAGGVLYVGNYGLLPGVEADVSEGMREARAQIEAALHDLPCVEMEDKGTGFSIHYRNCGQPEAVRLRLLDLASPVATMANARLMEGKKVIEVVPGSLPTKRTAVLRLIQDSEARGVVYLGDDLSDVVVFEELASLRSAGKLDAFGIAVADPETEEAVRVAADMSLGDVTEAGGLLIALSAVLGRNGGSIDA